MRHLTDNYKNDRHLIISHSSDTYETNGVSAQIEKYSFWFHHSQGAFTRA